MPARGLYWAHYTGKVQPIQLTAHFQGNPPTDLVVRNYPFDPKDFTQGDGGTIRPLRNITHRMFPIHLATNYTSLGGVTRISLSYDFGLQYTNKVPLVQRLKLKHTE